MSKMSQMFLGTFVKVPGIFRTQIRTCKFKVPRNLCKGSRNIWDIQGGPALRGARPPPSNPMSKMPQRFPGTWGGGGGGIWRVAV